MDSIGRDGDVMSVVYVPIKVLFYILGFDIGKVCYSRRKEHSRAELNFRQLQKLPRWL